MCGGEIELKASRPAVFPNPRSVSGTPRRREHLETGAHLLRHSAKPAERRVEPSFHRLWWCSDTEQTCPVTARPLPAAADRKVEDRPARHLPGLRNLWALAQRVACCVECRQASAVLFCRFLCEP